MPSMANALYPLHKTVIIKCIISQQKKLFLFQMKDTENGNNRTDAVIRIS